MTDLWRRVRQLERDIYGRNKHGPPMIVRVTGGMPSDGPDIAQIDGELLCREPYETPALFEARVMEHADAMAARLIVIGGLQPMPQE